MKLGGVCVGDSWLRGFVFGGLLAAGLLGATYDFSGDKYTLIIFGNRVVGEKIGAELIVTVPYSSLRVCRAVGEKYTLTSVENMIKARYNKNYSYILINETNCINQSTGKTE